ncbi:MAG: heparan-alpha-glucosaminide N-acetyltransferase domain-containing protein [Bacteroidota bacterium]|nr:heparan-alpha-glucosaminide N-acetyltransferase domain-containing protein [Bacteroidota bacterium]
MEQNLKNNKRIILLDVMRAWAVFMMIQGHTIDALLSDSYYNGDSLLFNIWQFNRGLTAPIFLFGSGFAYVIATFRKMDGGTLPRAIVFRRLRWIGVLFLIGSLMHLPAGTLGDMFTLQAERWHRFFHVDVLRLMAVTLLGMFVLFTLVRTRARLFRSALGIGLFFLLVAPVVYMVDWSAHTPLWFAAWMTTATGSWFPLFPFSGFMFLGAAAAALYMRWQTEGRTARLPLYYGMAGAALLLLFFVPREILEWGITFDGGSSSIWLSFSRLGWVLLLWAVIGALMQRTQRIPDVIPVAGQHTLFIYVSHIVALYGSAWMPGLRQTFGKTLELEPVLVIIGILIAGTTLAAYWMHTQKLQKTVVYRYLPYAAMVVLATVLLFA